MIATRFATERLELLPLRVEYAGEMAGVLSARELYGFIGGEPPSVEQLTDRYRRQVAGSGRPGEHWLNWVISLDGVLVGYVQATVTGDEVEIAWVVGADWQGQGIAKEAAIGLAEWLRHSSPAVERSVVGDSAGRAVRGDAGAASGNGDLRIVAHVHPGHAASQAVARAVGLSATGELDADGEELWVSRPETRAGPAGGPA
ncbi:GNAT family N-acetyltransferase [Kribbella sp. CA-253562]|uniref:GNAT family N-acetyltransferase n=1 Tax=Kribbella sp. CA-253562 TaxID=3239942 RepID=UPI003D90029F